MPSPSRVPGTAAYPACCLAACELECKVLLAKRKGQLCPICWSLHTAHNRTVCTSSTCIVQPFEAESSESSSGLSKLERSCCRAPRLGSQQWGPLRAGHLLLPRLRDPKLAETPQGLRGRAAPSWCSPRGGRSLLQVNYGGGDSRPLEGHMGHTFAHQLHRPSSWQADTFVHSCLLPQAAAQAEPGPGPGLVGQAQARARAGWAAGYGRVSSPRPLHS